MSENNNQTKSTGFNPYEPMKVCPRTFYSPRSYNERTSLSVKYQRDYIILDFHRYITADNKENISKKLSLVNAGIFHDIIVNITRQRNAVAEKYDNFAEAQYPSVDGESATMTSIFMGQDKQFKENGNVYFHTIEIGGINRVALTATIAGNKVNPITVVFCDDSGLKIVKRASQYTTIDTQDIPFYQFGQEIKSLLGGSFMYVCFDKIYQMLQVLMPKQSNDNQQQNNNQKKSWFGGNKNNYSKNYQNSSKAQEFGGSSSSEEGIDAFDGL